MTIITTDNRLDELTELTNAIRQTCPDAEVIPFQDHMLAVKYAFHHAVDIFITEIETHLINGFATLRTIRKLHLSTSVVLASQEERYREDAAKAGADGFLLKPVSIDQAHHLIAKLEQEAYQAGIQR